MDQHLPVAIGKASRGQDRCKGSNDRSMSWSKETSEDATVTSYFPDMTLTDQKHDNHDKALLVSFAALQYRGVYVERAPCLHRS